MEENFNLDYTDEEFDALIRKAGNIVLDRYHALADKKAFAGLTPEKVQQWLDEPLPKDAMPPIALLDLVKEKVIDTATLNIGPHFFAYIIAGGTHISLAAEMLATGINQNVGKWHLSPVVSEMEKRVVQWGADFINYGTHAGGVLVSGGSAANLTGLTVARNIYFEQENVRAKGLFGLKPFIVYASEEAHGCIDKSVEELGIGTDNYRKISVHEDHTINLEALKKQILADRKAGFLPFCLIGNAGTVNTGAIDPLNALAGIAKNEQMWFHVDGAYGGLAAGILHLQNDFKGLERADSVAVDFHKWLYQPLEAGCTLVKGWDKLNRTYYKKAAYLDSDTRDDGRFDFNEHHFQLSRNAKSLKIWMTFKAYGSDNIKSAIAKDITLAKYLADLINQSEDFSLCNVPKLSITCFRYLGADSEKRSDPKFVDTLNKAIIPALERDGRVFITGTTLQNRPVIRTCLVNHRIQKSNIDHLVQVIREVGQQVAQLV